MRAEYRIAGNCHQHVIARIDQRGRQDREGRFAADRVQHLGLGIDALDAANAVEVARGGLFQDRVAIVRVAAVLGQSRLGAQFLDHLRERHLVGFAHPEVNDIRPGMQCHRGAFGPFDALEFIDRLRLAVLAAADAVGEELLDVGVGHFWLVVGCQWSVIGNQ